MTFASEAVRHAFHALPTQTQLDYSGLEIMLAAEGRELHIEEVRREGTRLQVILRITENLN